MDPNEEENNQDSEEKGKEDVKIEGAEDTAATAAAGGQDEENGGEISEIPSTEGQAPAGGDEDADNAVGEEGALEPEEGTIVKKTSEVQDLGEEIEIVDAGQEKEQTVEDVKDESEMEKLEMEEPYKEQKSQGGEIETEYGEFVLYEEEDYLEVYTEVEENRYDDFEEEEEVYPCPGLEPSISQCKQEPVCVCPPEDMEIKRLPEPQEDPLGVLSEDHPLLQRFQETLQTHLLKIREQLSQEVQDLDYGIKQKEKEREEVGEKLYDLQQEICRQNSILDDYAHKIKELHEQRAQDEKVNEDSQKELKNRRALSKESKRHYNELLMELTSLQTLEINMQKWMQEVEDEVIAAKRMVTKDSKDQQAISLEKKKMDLLIFNLENEIRKKEKEQELLEHQIVEEKEVVNSLRNSLSDACADLEALQQEQKRLTQAWMEVITAIQHRDKVLHAAKSNLTAEEERFKLLCANIEGAKKDAAKEMEKNEKLEAFKTRIQEDMKNLKRQYDRENETISKIEARFAEIEALTKETENDYQLAKQEGNCLEVQLRPIQHKLDKEVQKKVKFEDETMKCIQDTITNDKATKHHIKLVRDVQSQRRSLELTLSQTENSISNNLLEIEKCKGNVIRLKEDNDSLNKKLDELNAEIASINQQINDTLISASLNNKQIEILQAQIDKIIQKSGGTEEAAADIKIKGLERQIQEAETQTRNLQQFWLTLQSHVVNLTEKRSTQLNELQIARKQVMVINQKTLKINEELEEAKKQGLELSRNVKNLTAKLDTLGAKLFEKKKSSEKDESESCYMHFEMIEKLKNAEMGILKIEQEIVDLNQEIEQMKELVLEKHREALSWETKYKTTEDIARWRRTDNNEGEISKMKAEIRRMQVRYNHLRRAQEKLVHDLENCVIHREKIFYAAMTRQKMDGKQDKSRSNVQHKLNDIKNKIKEVNNEFGLCEKGLENLQKEYDEAVKAICKMESNIENEKMQDKLIMAEIDEGLLMKYRNLDDIVRKQKRAKYYHLLVCCATLPKCKPEPVLDREICKHTEVNDNLTEIGQQLLHDYPEHKLYLKRILQTLKDEE